MRLNKLISGLGEQGQTTIEWTLLLAVTALPLMTAIRYLLGAMTEYYRMITFLETLPYP